MIMDFLGSAEQPPCRQDQVFEKGSWLSWDHSSSVQWLQLVAWTFFSLSKTKGWNEAQSWLRS